MTKILAIESSCDETAAAVVADGRQVLSSVVYSQVKEHQLYGGVVPEIASRRHIEQICAVVQQALDEANTTVQGIDAVAVTAWPGLIGALLVGVNYAKGLALAAGKPLIPVHHIRGHVAANYITHPQLTPPFLALIVSGGHSHLVQVHDYTHYEILGRTRDDAAGEAFDKAARAMGLPYPGGIAIDRLAQKGNPHAFILPHPRVEGSAYDFSFSGLKTAVINLVHNANQKGQQLPIEDLAASFNHTVAQILCQHLADAAQATHPTSLVVAGGVSANSMLRAMLTQTAQTLQLPLYLPALSLCGDNAAMIGAQGYYEYLAGHLAGMDLNAQASCPIDYNPPAVAAARVV